MVFIQIVWIQWNSCRVLSIQPFI